MKEDDDDQSDSTGQSHSRYATLPSRVALQHMMGHMSMAEDGRRLMKWSTTATGRELRKVAAQMCSVYESYYEDVRDAFIALARSRYFYPNVNKMVLENAPEQACVTIGKTYKSVAGCKYNIYELEKKCDAYPCLGIEKGGMAIAETKRLWYELLLRLVEVGQLRTNFLHLDESHRNTTKKANVLGKVIIPRTKLTIQYILAELEELEREEFFRLKKILEVKYRDKKTANKEEAPKAPEAPKPPEAPKALVVPKPPEPPKVPKAPEPPKVAKAPEPPKVVKAPEPPKPPEEPPPAPPCVECKVCEEDVAQPITPSVVPEEPMDGNAAIEILKQSLSKVITAAADYEKTAPSDNIKEFKATASDLREKLELLALQQRTAGKNSVELKLGKPCDKCNIANRQATEKCIVCGNLISLSQDVNQAAIKEINQQLQKQLDITLSVITDYESKGLCNDQIKEYKETASRLKLELEGQRIPRDVNLNKLCMVCKALYELQYAVDKKPSEDTQSKKIIQRNENSNQSVYTPMEKNVQVKESHVSTMSSEEETRNVPLGVFETEEITEVIQVRNADGTTSEKRRVVTIVRKMEDHSVSQKSSKGSSSYKSNKMVGLVTIIPPRLLSRVVKSAKSDSFITKLPVTDHVIRACLSSTFNFGFKEYYKSLSVHRNDSDTSDTLVSGTDDEKISNGSESSSRSNEECSGIN